MANQMMNSGSSNEVSILYDKTYSGSFYAEHGSFLVGFAIDKLVEGYKNLSLTNIACGITSVKSTGNQEVSISNVSYDASTGYISVNLSSTGSGQLTVYTNCKVIA